MAEDQDIARAVANLDAYLDTWTDGSGGLHGLIVHHHRDYTVLTSPATWSQSLRILANLEIWEKTREERWLDKAYTGSLYLVNSYVWEEHLFHDSTTPLTLINNSWPCLALARTAETLREVGRDGYGDLLGVARDCIENRVIAEYWDGETGDFFHCPPGFPSRRVHTFNQSAITISALCALAGFDGKDDLIKTYAMPAADYLIKNQVVGEGDPLRGGWGYNDGDSGHLFYYLYTALNCRGLIDIYESTGDKRYLESAGLAGQHLVGMLDDVTGLFAHRYVRKRGGIETHPYPAMVATSGLGLKQMLRLNRLGFELNVERNIGILLGKQQPHGGFPGFIGSTDIWTPDLYPCEPGKTKWRDVLCCPFWAGFTLELLADLLPEGVAVPRPDIVPELVTETDDGYVIEENERRVRLIKDGRTISYFGKRDGQMLFSTEKMRGVPFGAFDNPSAMTIMRLKRRIRLGAIATGVSILSAMVIIIYLVLT